jgi:hypothetical protein
MSAPAKPKSMTTKILTAPFYALRWTAKKTAKAGQWTAKKTAKPRTWMWNKTKRLMHYPTYPIHYPLRKIANRLEQRKPLPEPTTENQRMHMQTIQTLNQQIKILQTNPGLNPGKFSREGKKLIHSEAPLSNREGWLRRTRSRIGNLPVLRWILPDILPIKEPSQGRFNEKQIEKENLVYKGIPANEKTRTGLIKEMQKDLAQLKKEYRELCAREAQQQAQEKQKYLQGVAEHSAAGEQGRIKVNPPQPPAQPQQKSA